MGTQSSSLSAGIDRWAGKALGAAAALIFAPATPAGVLGWLAAGLVLGHVLDRLLQNARGRDPGTGQSGAAPGDPDRAAPGEASTRFVFAVLGRIAQSGGEVAAAHLRQADQLMADWHIPEAQRPETRVWFQAGRDPSFPFETLATLCRAELAEAPHLREAALKALCRMSVLADSPDATAALLDLGPRLGCDRETVAQRALLMAAMRPEPEPLGDACRILGVRPGDDRDTIRLAYRRQIAQWHPDRLPADAGEDYILEAQRRMTQLREALETLLAAAH